METFYKTKTGIRDMTEYLKELDRQIIEENTHGNDEVEETSDKIREEIQKTTKKLKLLDNLLNACFTKDKINMIKRLVLKVMEEDQTFAFLNDE